MSNTKINLMVRKSKHVIINEDHSADRLRQEDKSRADWHNTTSESGSESDQIPSKDDGPDGVGVALLEPIAAGPKVVTLAAYKWEDQQITPTLTTRFDSAEPEFETQDDVLAQESWLQVRCTGFLKSFDEFLMGLYYFGNYIFGYATNQCLWNVMIVICNVFFEIFFQLVIGVATVMIAIILNLDDSYTFYESRKKPGPIRSSIAEEHDSESENSTSVMTEDESVYSATILPNRLAKLNEKIASMRTKETSRIRSKSAAT